MTPLAGDPELAIADAWQRGFPFAERPFAVIGAAQGMSEAEVVAAFARLGESGRLGRIGAVVRPYAAGASTLAALSAPPAELDAVAALVSAEPYVNHNYERDHPINLWFVVAAPDEGELGEILQRIAARTGRRVLDLRLIEPYHLDLGFRLGGEKQKPPAPQRAARAATADERRLLGAIEDGLPIVERPFLAVAERLGWSEPQVLDSLAAMQESGVIARFGCVLNHHELGFTANAMAVWDVADDVVSALGRRMAALEEVTLCYRRQRAPPDWPYNLFAMVHGRDAGAVRRRVAEISGACGLAKTRHAVLFSRRRYRQRGARFSRQPLAQTT